MGPKNDDFGPALDLHRMRGAGLCGLLLFGCIDPGLEGEPCTPSDRCAAGLRCHPERRECAPVAEVEQACGEAKLCGLPCGACAGPTEVCEAGRCVDVCEGRACGAVQGFFCGACAAAEDRCIGNQCIAPWGLPRVHGAYLAIEPGTFTMGSPRSEDGRFGDETQWTVTLSRGFWMKATEVTSEEWDALGSPPRASRPCEGNCPVTGMSWYAAVSHVNAMSRRAGLQICYPGTGELRAAVGVGCAGFRLPTEAEWEFAARAGTEGPRYGELSAIAWWGENAGGTVWPVAQLEPNAWGLYDMLGNVWEWVHDGYGRYPVGSGTDPEGTAGAPLRIVRGCSARTFDVLDCRAATRSRADPLQPYIDVGLRPVRTIF